MNISKFAQILLVSTAAVGLVQARPAAAQAVPVPEVEVSVPVPVAGAAAFSIDSTGLVRGVATAAAVGPDATAQAAYAAGNSRAQAFVNGTPAPWTVPSAGATYSESQAVPANTTFSVGGIFIVETETLDQPFDLLQTAVESLD